ncbi:MULTISPECIES: cytochrome P450 [Streptomyces]|uniref:cytochrome P450 n=1 Tax=Streptomyces TaxID=1883 RepID=UPI000ACC265B|nr:cytochrome P450 [Streptomyces sp. SID7805]
MSTAADEMTEEGHGVQQGKERALTDSSDPSAWFALMRREHPVVREEQFGMWQVFRYEDVAKGLSDPATFSSDARGQMAALPDFHPFTQGNFMMMDPPAHRRVRSLVSSAFTPRAVAQLAPRITAVAKELLDALDGAEEFDFIAAFAHPIPVIVLADLLGLPREDSRHLLTWAKVLTGVDVEAAPPGAAGAQAPPDPMASLREMNGYLREHIARRRAAPTDDLLGRLAAAEQDGERLTDDEIVGVASLLLIAGHLMVTMLLANLMLCLDEHPRSLAGLRADDMAVSSTIEEVLRYRNPADRQLRYTTREVEIAGQTIPAGERVLFWTGSANRDEARFEQPEKFDIHRRPNPHMGFGHGVHFCLGAPLGRLEATIALRLVLDRFADFKVADGVEYFGSYSLIKKLPMKVRWC